ncbi:MAG: hypothetical protein M3O88_03575 [Actinomycetota bacterium]|nr:hypothetical protein [Actinomycetota bacterium]
MTTNWLIDRRESVVHIRLGEAPFELEDSMDLIDSLEPVFVDEDVARIVVEGREVKGKQEAIRATLIALATHTGVWGKEFEFRASIVQLPEVDEVSSPSE